MREKFYLPNMKESDMTERLCTYHKIGHVGKEVKRNSVSFETLINMYCFSLPHFSSSLCQYHALLSSSFQSFINPELSDSCPRKDDFRKKKKCLVKVQTSVKRRVYVCVSLCLHTGSHVKRISRPWSNKVPSHSQSTMKGRSHSISALCPAQKKERQTRGVGEKRREEKINGKC